MKTVLIVSCCNDGIINFNDTLWARQFPNKNRVWGDYRFVFDQSIKDYDYLVVYDDLPSARLERYCSPRNTIHLSTEPPTIGRYTENFLRQFAVIVTQDPQVKHSQKVFSQGGLLWWLGINAWNSEGKGLLSFEELQSLFDRPKSKLISVTASNAKSLEGHRLRGAFARRLKEHFGDRLDLFGRGVRPMEDKIEGLLNYRFHVVIENSSYDHYFSEKLSDCLLAGSYPIYYGCPNIGEYLPENSFQRIDINDFEGSVALIERVIAEDRDQVFREELRLARDRIMYEHNIYPMIIRLIENLESGVYGDRSPSPVMGKRILPILDCPDGQIGGKLRKIPIFGKILSKSYYRLKKSLIKIVGMEK